MSGVEWAPNLPRGWDRASLRWLAEIYAGGTPNKEKLEFWTNGTIPWLNSGSVNDWSIKTPSALISSEGYSGSSAKWIPVGSVVIALAGQGKTKGMAARLEIDSTCNQSMAAIVPGRELNYRFLHFWLAANYQNIRNMAGGDKRDGLNLVHIGSIEVPLPPLGEQQAIADYLDSETQRIDELIAEQRGLIETLRERRRGATLSLLSGLDVGGDRWSSGSFVFPSLPAGWGTVALGRIGDSKSGSGFPPAHQGQQGRELQFYKVKHLGLADGADVINGADDTISRETAVSLRAHVFPAGTIVYAKVGAALMLGRIRTLGAEGCIDNNMAGFTPFDVADSRYVQLAMSAIPFDYLVNPGAVPSLSDKKLMAMKIPFPSPQVRHAIARSIDHQTSRIDALIAESEDLIALSLERRAALITAAVTGQIDVRTAA